MTLTVVPVAAIFYFRGAAVLFYDLLEDGNGDDLALHAAVPGCAAPQPLLPHTPVLLLFPLVTTCLIYLISFSLTFSFTRSCGR